MSATADRSARAIQRSLFMAAMVIRGFSWASRERGREKSRELREKPRLCSPNILALLAREAVSPRILGLGVP